MNRYELPLVLTPEIAATCNISRARIRTEVRRGNWQRLAPGAILTSHRAPTREDWAAVGLWLGGDGAAVSAWDAARAYGLGESTPPDAPVLILTRTSDNRRLGDLLLRPTRRPYRITTTSPESSPLPLTPIVHPARAVADAALLYRSPTKARALVTSAVQRSRCTVEELVEEYRNGPRQNSRNLRLALADALAGARSVAEATAIRRLSRPGIPPFEVNVELSVGRWVVVVDVYWRELRAVLEVDSREYHFSETDWKGHHRPAQPGDLSRICSYALPTVGHLRSRSELGGRCRDLASRAGARTRNHGATRARRSSNFCLINRLHVPNATAATC